VGPRRQQYVVAAWIAVTVIGVIAVGLVARRPSLPPGPQIQRLEEAVSLGLLDLEVLTRLRATGESRAIVNLDTEPVINRLRASLGADKANELLGRMSTLFVANKQFVLGPLGSNAEIVRDYTYLGAAAVDFRSEAALLEVVRNPLIRSVTADIGAAPTKTKPIAERAAPLGATPFAFEGAGVAVGIIDSGVDAARYKSYFPTGSVAETREVAPDDQSPDDMGHGTHVSSIVLLMAPQAKLYVADVFHKEFDFGSGRIVDRADQVDVLSGMDWLIGLKASGVNLRAVNLSLGRGHVPPGICTDRYHFAEARLAGIIPVVAAGNSAFEDNDFKLVTTYQSGINASACNPATLSVGSVSNGSCLDKAVDIVADYSQSSPELDIVAPGECIVAAGGELSGTSMAAPHVAGAVAVLASAKNVGPDAIWAALTNTGPVIVDPHSQIARHRLDIPAALDYLLGATLPLATPVIELTRGVAVGVETLTPPSALSRGQRYTFDSFAIRNTGTATAIYEVVADDSPSPVAGRAASPWFTLTPRRIELQPGGLRFVSAQVDVPSNAEPGDYAIRIRPLDNAAAVNSTGGVRVTFTVQGPGASGVTGGPVSGGQGGDAVSQMLDNPVLLLGGLVGLGALYWLFARSRRGAGGRAGPRGTPPGTPSGTPPPGPPPGETAPPAA